MKKWPFFAIILPWMARYGSKRSFLLIFSARDDLVKVSWKSDVGKCQNQLTPPYFDQLSERHQLLWDLVSIGKRLLKRSRKSPNFTHKSQISPLLRDAKQSPKFDILYWKHWFRDLASGIIIRKIESVSFGTFNDRLSARRLPRNTWEHKKQSLKPNQLSGDQTCQDNMRRLQGNIGKVSQCDAWGICRWFLKCSVGPFGDNLTSVERIWEDLIKCAELKCDAVDTSCKGVADVDAPDRFDKSAHLDKSLQIHQEI